MKRSIIFLMAYLLIFALIFGLALYDYLHNLPLINIGFSAKLIDITIMFLAFFSIVKTVWHIYSF